MPLPLSTSDSGVFSYLLLQRSSRTSHTRLVACDYLTSVQFSCNGRGWIVCDFYNGQKTTVESENSRMFRRCPSCRAGTTRSLENSVKTEDYSEALSHKIRLSTKKGSYDKRSTGEGTKSKLIMN